MSTKTLLKRIALVAVSALGAGLLSVAPASADYYNGTDFEVRADVLCTGISSSTLTVPVGASIRLGVYDSEDGYDAVVTGPLTLGNGSLVVGEDVLVSTNDLGQTLLEDVNFDEDTDIDYVTLNATAVGTATIADATSTGRIDTADDLTVKIVAACTTNTLSLADSFVSVTADGTDSGDNEDWASDPDNSDVQTYAQADGSLFVRIYANNAYGDSLPAAVWSASATNGATVAFGDDVIPEYDSAIDEAGPLPVAVYTGGDEDGITVRVDPKDAGVPQTTTVTVTRNGVQVTSKTLTFYGEATKLSVVGNVSGLNGENGFAMYALTDAAGNKVPGSVYVDSTTLTNRINAGGTYDDAEDNESITFGSTTLPKTVGILYYACNAAYGTGANDLTFKHDSSINGNTISATVKASCSGTTDTYTVSTDKASYKIGEIATVTITAKDSTGAAVSDQAEMGANATVTAGGMTIIGAVDENDTFTAGSKSYKFQVLVAGSFNAVALINGSTTKSATASYTVTSGDTSLNDVLAAIVSLIASINKQIKALQKSLKKK